MFTRSLVDGWFLMLFQKKLPLVRITSKYETTWLNKQSLDTRSVTSVQIILFFWPPLPIPYIIFFSNPKFVMKIIQNHVIILKLSDQYLAVHTSPPIHSQSVFCTLMKAFDFSCIDIFTTPLYNSSLKGFIWHTQI